MAAVSASVTRNRIMGRSKSAVLLKFGARATGEPADFHDFACDSAAAGLDIDLPTARPRVMKAERTFWE
jgi:hypothetical protein